MYIFGNVGPWVCPGRSLYSGGPAGREEGGAAVMDAVRLDCLSYRIETGINAARAIHEAMANGDMPAEDWLDGLHYVINKLAEDAKALRELVERGHGGDDRKRTD